MRFCNRKNVIIYFLQKSIYHTKDLIWYKNPGCIVNLSWKILYWIYILKSWFPNLFIQCRHQFIWLRAQHFKISCASDWLIEFWNQFYALSRIQINDLNNLKINKKKNKHWSRYPQLYSFHLWTYFLSVCSMSLKYEF